MHVALSNVCASTICTGTDGECRSKVECNEYGAKPFIQNMDPLPECTREQDRYLSLPHDERSCTYPRRLNESLWMRDLQQQCCSSDAEPEQALQAGLIGLMGFLIIAYVIIMKPLVGSFAS